MENRNEIKKKYKETLTPMGLILIRNNKNCKVYIEKSKNIPAAFNKNQFTLNMGSHMNEALQKEWKEFGEENFSFEVLDRLEPKEDPAYKYDEDLKTLEELWLDKLQPFGEKGYNKKSKSINIMKKLINIFLLLLLFTSYLSAQGADGRKHYLYYFENTDTLYAAPLETGKTASTKKILNSIAANLSNKIFNSYGSSYPSTGIKIKLKTLKCITTSNHNYKIAVMNIHDPEQICMGTFFQGSTGGRNTFVMLGVNLLQSQTNPPLVDGLIILYNNKPLPETDHINFDGIFTPKDFQRWSDNAVIKQNDK